MDFNLFLVVIYINERRTNVKKRHEEEEEEEKGISICTYIPITLTQ